MKTYKVTGPGIRDNFVLDAESPVKAIGLIRKAKYLLYVEVSSS